MHRPGRIVAAQAAVEFREQVARGAEERIPLLEHLVGSEVPLFGRHSRRLPHGQKRETALTVTVVGPWAALSFPRICARTIRHLVTPAHYGQTMGRPRIYEEPRVATAIRLPASLRDELQAVAVERNVSVNLLVTRAVLDYLERLPSLSDAPRGPRHAARRARVEATP